MSLFDYLDEREKEETGEESAPESSSGPLSVSDLTLQIKEVFEQIFAEVWVVGEISNLSRPRSGHLYLTLKDDGAQLPAVVWKTVASKVRFEPKDGLVVVCRGRIDVYPPHGKYQLIVSQLEPKGIGALELAFRQLHAKLQAEGLFEPAKKRPIPRWVRTVAVITSPSGAAVRDFLQVLGRRTSRVDVRIVPVKVQGDGSAEEIAAAIRLVNRLRLADCIVVTRGGGSAEDLWAFNEEVLVRAVAGSEIPTISAVGHEVDLTLCDLAADLRALTPSEAAERIAVEDAQLSERLVQMQRFLEDSLTKRIRLANERLRFFENQPAFARPLRLIEDRRRSVDVFEQSLDRSIQRKMEQGEARLAKLSAALEALSPLGVLARGYSLTQNSTGEVIRSFEQARAGETIRTRLAEGTIESEVRGVFEPR